MEAGEALAARRSCRSYSPEPIPSELLGYVLRAALQGPSAGNSDALDLVVLEGRPETDSYWDVTLPPGPRRDGFGWPGLLLAPVLVIPTVRPQSYVDRYAEPDKAGQMEYVRLHAGFCRRITVTPADLERLKG